MRKTLAFVAVLAFAGCGGGGAGAPPAPQQQQQQTPSQPSQAKYVTPTFVIAIPKRSNGKSRSPQYVASTTLSVKITLTADSNGVPPGNVGGNPAVTNVSAGSCSSGCTVNGPPTPPGTDSFTVVTYDAANAGGNALNAAQLNNVSITAGQNNAESVTLGAIPASLSVQGVPSSFTAGTQDQTATVSVAATDADGNTIPTGQSPAVSYVDATGAALSVTLADPDTGSYGSCVSSAGSTACTSGNATSITFAGPDGTGTFRYDGLAQTPVTLTASASGATSGTAAFQPTLNAPAFNSSAATPSGVALTSSAEIDLFATSNTGSTGTEYFTESGWTNSPYGHALTFANSGACASGSGLATSMSQIATISAGTNSTANGTPFTATAVASPKAGSCPSTISDGLSANTTDGSATLTVTYTTGSINASSLHRGR